MPSEYSRSTISAAAAWISRHCFSYCMLVCKCVLTSEFREVIFSWRKGKSKWTNNIFFVCFCACVCVFFKRVDTKLAVCKPLEYSNSQSTFGAQEVRQNPTASRFVWSGHSQEWKGGPRHCSLLKCCRGQGNDAEVWAWGRCPLFQGAWDLEGFWLLSDGIWDFHAFLWGILVYDGANTEN